MLDDFHSRGTVLEWPQYIEMLIKMWSGLCMYRIPDLSSKSVVKIPKRLQVPSRPAYLKYVFAEQYLSSVQFNTYRSHCFFYIVEAVQG